MKCSVCDVDVSIPAREGVEIDFCRDRKCHRRSFLDDLSDFD